MNFEPNFVTSNLLSLALRRLIASVIHSFLYKFILPTCLLLYFIPTGLFPPALTPLRLLDRPVLVRLTMLTQMVFFFVNGL